MSASREGTNAPALAFSMRSEKTAVAPAVERIVEALRAVGLRPARLDDSAVAVAEAISNAAIHGNGLVAEKPVEIRVQIEPGKWGIVDIKDQGPGFDFLQLADPTAPERLLEDRGRGVFLMKRLVDRVEYLDGGSRVRLTFGS